MTVIEFIENILIEEIYDIQRNGNHHYLSFGLISQGIEFLGACLDEEEFHKAGLSRNRFRKAIKDLFPIEYQTFNDKNNPFDLYTNLRCGVLHIVLPKINLELIQKNEIPRFNASHLEFSSLRGNKRLILVSQDFYDDFRKAGEKVIEKIKNGELLKNKVDRKVMVT